MVSYAQTINEPSADRAVTRGRAGPRTQAGKARSAQNSFKHGLSASGPSVELSFAAIDAVYLRALEAQDAILMTLERDLGLLESQADEAPMKTLDRNLSALVAIERYVGRAFTRRQTAVRRGLIDVALEVEIVF